MYPSHRSKMLRKKRILFLFFEINLTLCLYYTVKQNVTLWQKVPLKLKFWPSNKTTPSFVCFKLGQKPTKTTTVLFFANVWTKLKNFWNQFILIFLFFTIAWGNSSATSEFLLIYYFHLHGTRKWVLLIFAYLTFHFLRSLHGEEIFSQFKMYYSALS